MHHIQAFICIFCRATSTEAEASPDAVAVWEIETESWFTAAAVLASVCAVRSDRSDRSREAAEISEVPPAMDLPLLLRLLTETSRPSRGGVEIIAQLGVAGAHVIMDANGQIASRQLRQAFANGGHRCGLIGAALVTLCLCGLFVLGLFHQPVPEHRQGAGNLVDFGTGALKPRAPGSDRPRPVVRWSC